MSFFIARGLIACALVLSPILVRAEEVLPGNGAPLTLQDAVTRTLQSSPALKVFGYELSAQNGRTRQVPGTTPTE